MNRYNVAQTAILIGLTILLICIARYFGVAYSDNDDAVYAGILSGIYSGEPSTLTVYIGQIYGSAIAGLFKILPYQEVGIDWYALVMHTLYILSFVVIEGRILFSRFTKIVIACASLALTAIFVYLIVAPQFTVIAGVLALAVVVLLLGSKVNIWRYAIAVIFFIIGSQIRLSAFLMVFVPLFPFVIYPMKWRNKSFRIKLIGCTALLGMMIIESRLEQNIYRADDQWKYFMEFNAPRGQIEQNSVNRQAASLFTDSIPRGQYELMCDFGIVDGRLISIDSLNKCADTLAANRTANLKVNYHSYIFAFTGYGVWALALWLLWLLCLMWRRDRFLFWITAAACIVLVLECLYCASLSFVKDRLIVNITLTSLAICCMISCRILKSDELKYASVMVAVLMTGVFIYKTYKWEANIDYRIAEAAEVNALLEKLPDEKVHILSAPRFAETYSVLKTPCTVKYIGKDWLNNIPLHAKWYSGYTSLVNGVAILKPTGNNENINLIINLLNNYYDIPVRCITIARSDNYEVVKIIKL